MTETNCANQTKAFFLCSVHIEYSCVHQTRARGLQMNTHLSQRMARRHLLKEMEWVN